ncbi:hypothetical protein [Candidatus Poriferisocius sp.]|uniref:hypothetical protein n=1 Tax=Candidatus Poriferisocius sp. TaxID=3101276 RepID=UPI003B01A960
MKDDERFARRLYTVAEAARFVGMHPSTLRTWARGFGLCPACRVVIPSSSTGEHRSQQYVPAL